VEHEGKVLGYPFQRARSREEIAGRKKCKVIITPYSHQRDGQKKGGRKIIFITLGFMKGEERRPIRYTVQNCRGGEEMKKL